MGERTAMPSGPFSVVAIAASAGGLVALGELLRALPPTFRLPVLVVQHIEPSHESLMAPILARRTALKVRQAVAGDRPVGGTVYLAPPDQHLEMADDGTILLSRTMRVHFVRPSADRLFMSVAEHAGAPSIAVVLSGTGVDGAAGAAEIHAHGGVVVAQDPASAAFAGMPAAAIATGAVDYVLGLPEIARLLERLVKEAA